MDIKILPNYMYNNKFKDYHIVSPMKSMIPKDYNYYEFIISYKIMQEIKKELGIHNWINTIVGEYQVDWDLYHTQYCGTNSYFKFSMSEQYYIRFRYKIHAIEFKLKWL